MDPEPITADPTKRIRRPVFIQSWEPCAFLHWPVEVRDVTPLLPPGCQADTFEGRTYVGLIPLVIRRVQLFGRRPLPYVSTFVELNVRLYSVDAEGRRGIVFRSLDAERLLPVLAAQATYRLPYKWARMSYDRSGDEHRWTSVRRWPGPRGARLTTRIRVGAEIAQPDPFARFLTARWNLHTALPGRQTAYAATEHDPWPLYHAEVLELDEDVIAAAGLPTPTGDPHVLFSYGVTARIGRPIRVRPSHG
ncbi:MAG: DUF2071 domain-containing protein [Mycobacteriales bacterium]